MMCCGALQYAVLCCAVLTLWLACWIAAEHLCSCLRELHEQPLASIVTPLRMQLAS